MFLDISSLTISYSNCQSPQSAMFLSKISCIHQSASLKVFMGCILPPPPPPPNRYAMHIISPPFYILRGKDQV